MSVVVSHFSPDLDSVTSAWIVLRRAGLTDPRLAFVRSGTTLNDQPADANPEVIHVDTGLGRFDHHQPDVAAPDVCAAKLVWQHYAPHDRALARMVEFVVEVDNGRLSPAEQQHPFGVTGLIHGLNLEYPNDPERVVQTMLPLLDAWYRSMVQVVAAEAEFERAEWFETPWGPGAALCETVGGGQQIAYAHGAMVFVSRNPDGWQRITAPARSAVDLTPVAETLQRSDPGAEWYLHPSKKLLLNGSTKAPPRHLSGLSLSQLVELVRHVQPGAGG